ncbi:MAG: hypothetical protein Q7J26_02865 [Brevundimonas sp.]|uniref:hypothetical protein n=1 Tax=Brevundimonas sp. TaxID=1871086 RepID=UPI00271A2B70|nr:hypothetical protein [Brevundimonas sp.]MDO9607442.1 hypothetical protein [Brevundimonas sp.]
MGKRAKRRLRGREKEGAALRLQYPGHEHIRAPLRLALGAPQDMQIIVEFLTRLEEAATDGDRSVLLDLHDTKIIDAVACVMLAAAMQKLDIECGVKVTVRMPRNGSARFALKLFGVTRDGEAVLEEAGGRILRVTSGMLGDPSPGARTFEVARLVEQFVSDQTLADKVHAALNEAADNVLSWAYGANSPPNPSERWWVAGMLTSTRATFIALDHGLGIPATAPQNFGDGLSGLIKTMMQDKEWKPVNLKPTDAQILLTTIRQRRTVSGLDERGKGLSSMIALIDRFSGGFINILSGDALYGYRNFAHTQGDDEYCIPLGFRFPGTLIIWQLEGGPSEESI